MTAKWHEEKKSVQDVQSMKEKLDAARGELEVAQRKGDLARAGELAYGVIPQLEKQLKDIEETETEALVHEAVTPEHIAQVVSRWTGIPVDKMLEGEREKLCTWKRRSKNASSARITPCARFPTPCAARARVFRIPTGPSVRSCSWARPASARPN